MLLKLRGMCAVLLAALAFAGCSDDDAASSLATNFDELEFSYEESDQQLLIRSTVPWTLDCTYLSGDGWLAFDRMRRPGDEGIVSQRVTIKALHNTGVERTAELHITGAGFDRKVTVVQEDGQVRIDGVELEGDMAKDEPVEKTYIATLEGRISGQVCRRLVTTGVKLDDGWIKLDRCAILDSSRESTLVKVVLHSGKNRIVRRIFGSIGFPVKRLVRTQIGPIKLGDLKSGTYRVLSQAEVRSLSKAVGL